MSDIATGAHPEAQRCFRLVCKSWRDAWPAQRLQHTAVINCVGNWTERLAHLGSKFARLKVQLRVGARQLAQDDLAQLLNVSYDTVHVQVQVDRSMATMFPNRRLVTMLYRNSKTRKLEVDLCFPFSSREWKMPDAVKTIATCVTKVCMEPYGHGLQAFHNFRHLAYGMGAGLPQGEVMDALQHLPFLDELTLTADTPYTSNMLCYLKILQTTSRIQTLRLLTQSIYSFPAVPTSYLVHVSELELGRTVCLINFSPYALPSLQHLHVHYKNQTYMKMMVALRQSLIKIQLTMVDKFDLILLPINIRELRLDGLIHDTAAGTPNSALPPGSSRLQPVAVVDSR